MSRYCPKCKRLVDESEIDWKTQWHRWKDPMRRYGDESWVTCGVVPANVELHPLGESREASVVISAPGALDES